VEMTDVDYTLPAQIDISTNENALTPAKLGSHSRSTTKACTCAIVFFTCLGFWIVLTILITILSERNGTDAGDAGWDKRYDGKCVWHSIRVPCWYAVNATNRSALITEIDLNYLNTVQLRQNGSYYYWEHLGFTVLSHPGATHEMAMTYNESDNKDRPYMLITQQLENAITIISFDSDWVPTDSFRKDYPYWSNNITRFTFGDSLGPNATNIHKLILDGLSDDIWWLVFESSSSVCRMEMKTFFRKDMIPMKEFITCWKIPYDPNYEWAEDFGVNTTAAIHTCVQDGSSDFWCAAKFPNPLVARLNQPWNTNYDGDRWTVWNFWNGSGSERWKPHFDVHHLANKPIKPLPFITATTPVYSQWDDFETTKRYIWFNSITTGHVGWFDSRAENPIPTICNVHNPIQGVDKQSISDEESWNTRPGGIAVTDKGNALVVSYMPVSVLLKVNRNCTTVAVSLNTGEFKYPILYITREQYISESERTTLFLGASTNDFPHNTLEQQITHPTEADAILVVHNFLAEDLTYSYVEIYETATKESWIHRVNIFSRFFEEARTGLYHAVYATELVVDRLLAISFSSLD